MLQEIAVDVISSRVAAAVCTAPPIRDNSSRRTVIQEQATAESYLNITYTPFVDSLQVRIQQSMAASLVRQPKHAVRSGGNAVVRCREKRGSRLARIRCNRVHCPAKPTVVGNSLSSFWVSLCPDRLHCKRKRHCF